MDSDVTIIGVGGNRYDHRITPFVQGLLDESAKLAKVADGGDKDAIVKQIGMTGKIGCGGCHKPFRGAKVKK